MKFESRLGGLEQHLEKLRPFRVAARLGSFHAASSELRLSQPALSRSVKALEVAIKVKLFERSRTGVRLTPEGRLLEGFCDQLFGSIANLERQIRSPDDPSAGVIRIGTFESLTFYLWPKLLKELKQRAPSLMVRLASGDETSLRAQLLSGKIQMVVEAEPRLDERVRSVPLYRDVFRAYGASGASGHSLSSPSLIYVGGARDQAGRSIRDHLLSAGLSSEHLAYELGTFSSAQEFALAGLGVAILPERLVKSRLGSDGLKLVSVKGLPSRGFGEHRICASYLEENRTDPKIKLVLEHLRSFSTGRV